VETKKKDSPRFAFVTDNRGMLWLFQQSSSSSSSHRYFSSSSAAYAFARI